MVSEYICIKQSILAVAASDKSLYVHLLEDKVTMKEHFSTSWFSFKSHLYEMDTFCWSLP